MRAPSSSTMAAVVRVATASAWRFILPKPVLWGSPTTLEGELGFIDTMLGGTDIDQDALALRASATTTRS